VTHGPINISNTNCTRHLPHRMNGNKEELRRRCFAPLL